MRETGNNRHTNEKILSIRLAPDGLYFSVISPSGNATGENRIQFDRSGDSAAEALERILESREEFSDDFVSVQIFLDTIDTVYVPAEAVDGFGSVSGAVSGDGEGADPVSASGVVSFSGEDWLKSVGICPAKSEKVIVSPAVADLCAVMAFDGKSIKALKARFGGRAAFFSPLQENIEMKDRLDMSGGACMVNLTESNFYITVFDGGGQLRVAEVYPCKSDADIVYYLHRLVAESGTYGTAGGRNGAGRKARIYIYGSRAAANIKTVRKYFKGAVCV
jgi:hypothetical protein